MRLVEIHALAGAMPSGIAITIDVLATANRLRTSAGRPPAFTIRAAGSASAVARALLGDGAAAARVDAKRAPDVMVVPGLGATTEPALLERLAKPDAAVAQRTIERAAGKGAAVAASCSSAFLVAGTGLLDGRRATTTWWLAPVFQRMHPAVELDADAMVVHDGPMTTAGAAMAHLDLMLAVVTRYGTPALAEGCARYLLLDGRQSQARYMAVGFLAAQDAHVARGERWARTRLESGITVDELAEAAGLSPRTFARRVTRATGLSPVRFLQRLRVERAVELLETTTLSVEEIARRVGYAEPTTLRRLLLRDAGGRPSELRRA